MTATRRQAREWAIQMLTAADLNPPEDKLAFMQAFWEELSSLDEADGGVVVKGKLRDFTFLSEVRVYTMLFDRYSKHLTC